MIPKDEIKKALELASPADQVEIKILNQAVLENMTTYRKNFSTANLKNWKTAERQLDDLVVKVLGGQETGTPAAGHLANINKVHAYLKENGWKVSPSAVYNHHKAGILMPDKTGRYAVEAVDHYAASNLRRLDGSRPADELAQQAEKKAAEIRRLNAQANILEDKAKISSAKWIRRTQYEKDLVSRAATLKSDLLSWCQGQAEGICHLVEGNEELIPDLIQHLVKGVETHLDRYVQ